MGSPFFFCGGCMPCAKRLCACKRARKRRQRSPPWPEMLKQSCAVFIAGLMAAAMWIWVQRIAIPHQQSEAAAAGIPRGNLSDLYPRWLGARELLLHGRDPYGSDITREIQTGYYGRPIDPNRPNDPQD